MLEDKLLSVSPIQWLVDQVVVLDWYDGPRQGLCALGQPAVDFIFECVDEELVPDGLDVRIFRLKELPAGSVAQFARELNDLGPGQVAKPVWAPIWKFPNEEARGRAEKLIGSLEDSARRTELLISTPDMKHFLSCWRMGTQRPHTIAIPESIPFQIESTRNLK